MDEKKKLSADELLKEIKRKKFNKAANIARGIIDDYENKIVDLPIENLVENPYQPRMQIKDKEVEELANSIKENGLLQPIVATPTEQKGKYYIVAGHRRAKAHELLNKKRIKTIIVDKQDIRSLAAKAIVENLQREDLNIIELALGLKRYKDEFNKSIDEIAQEIAKDRSTVYKILNILQLPDEVIKDLRNNKSTKDIIALSMINSFANTIKKNKKIPQEKIKEIQISLYFGFLEQGRKWLIREIKKKIGTNNKSKTQLTLKKGKNKVVFAINIPKLPEEKIRQIENFIKSII